MIAELKKGNIRLLVAVTYRRPSALSPRALFETLCAFTSEYHNIIITGDFNANFLTPSKTETAILINLIKTQALSIVSTEPTHHFTHSDPPSHTTLDLFIVNNIENVIYFSKSMSPFIAGHDLIHLILNIETPKPPPKTIVCRNLKNVNVAHLHQLLSSHLPSSFFMADTVTDIDYSEQSLSLAIFKGFEHINPLRSITILPKHKH